MHPTRIANQQLARLATRALAIFTTVGLATPAFAQGMAFGQGLLQWAGTNLIAPLGILAVVVALAASIFRPEMVRSAIYAAIICAALFFIIRVSGTVLTMLQS